MWDFLSGLFDLLGSLPGRRVTVDERYEMKRKVRELKRKEKAAKAKADEPSR